MNKKKEDIKFSKTIFGEEVGSIIRVYKELTFGREFLLLFDNVRKEILHSECDEPIWLLNKLQAL